MRSPNEIKIRLTETIGEVRRLDNKYELFQDLSCEEWEVLDALRAERDALSWVVS